MPPISDREREERQTQVGRALASVRLEGLDPSRAAMAIFDRYVNGELTVHEMVAEIHSLDVREFGPVHVSED